MHKTKLISVLKYHWVCYQSIDYNINARNKTFISIIIVLKIIISFLVKDLQLHS